MAVAATLGAMGYRYSVARFRDDDCVPALQANLKWKSHALLRRKPPSPNERRWNCGGCAFNTDGPYSAGGLMNNAASA